MLSWPHGTSNSIINICFWFLETCTKCSYFTEENMRPRAQRLAFEVKYEYIVRRSTNISWVGQVSRQPALDVWINGGGYRQDYSACRKCVNKSCVLGLQCIFAKTCLTFLWMSKLRNCVPRGNSPKRQSDSNSWPGQPIFDLKTWNFDFIFCKFWLYFDL